MEQKHCKILCKGRRGFTERPSTVWIPPPKEKEDSEWAYVSGVFSPNISRAGPDQSTRKYLLSFVRHYHWSLPTPSSGSIYWNSVKMGKGKTLVFPRRVPTSWCKTNSSSRSCFCSVGARNLDYVSPNSSPTPQWTSPTFPFGVPCLSRTGCHFPRHCPCILLNKHRNRNLIARTFWKENGPTNS